MSRKDIATAVVAVIVIVGLIIALMKDPRIIILVLLVAYIVFDCVRQDEQQN